MVREAVIADLENVTEIVNKYRDFYGVKNQQADDVRSFIYSRITNNQSKIFLAFEETKVVGFIQLYPSYSTVSLKPQWVLNDFYVEKDFRQKGYGTQLMEFVKEYFKTIAKGFILVTDIDNIEANAFYRKNGWETGEYNFYTFFYK